MKKGLASWRTKGEGRSKILFLVSCFGEAENLKRGRLFLFYKRERADGSRVNKEEGESKLFRVFREVGRRGGSKGVGFSFWF